MRHLAHAFLYLAMTAAPQAGEIRFSDATAAAGIDLAPTPSFGSSWGDFDGDGWVDLFMCNHWRKPSLYRNRGDGTFEDWSQQVGLHPAGDTHGACWGDYDNDGDLDLYQCLGSPYAGKSNRLYRWDAPAAAFTDVAAAAGLTDPAGRGRTPTWYDHDRDGHLDLFMANARDKDPYSHSRLFLNRGDNTFADASVAAGLGEETDGHTVALGDLTGDAAPDLVCAKQGLFYNNGTGVFAWVPGTTLTNVEDIVASDYDNDGDLDVYLVRCNGGDTFEVSGVYLGFVLQFFDPGDKGFVIDAGAPSSLTFDLAIPSYGAVPAQACFVGSASAHPPDSPFTLHSESPETHGRPSFVSQEDLGVFIWFDASAEVWHVQHSVPPGNRLEINGVIAAGSELAAVTPTGFPGNPQPLANQLFRNEGNGRFTELAAAAGVADTGMGRSAVWADFDNDGDDDLYVVNSGPILNEANCLFENRGDGTFANVAAAAGAEGLVAGRGESVTTADYDNDGFMDLFVLNGFESLPFGLGRRLLLRNEGNSNHWLQIRLAGLSSNRDGIGTTIEVQAGPHRIVRRHDGAVHAWCQNDPILHVGLGAQTRVDTLTITWPSGISQRVFDLHCDQRLLFEEPNVP